MLIVEQLHGEQREDSCSRWAVNGFGSFALVSLVQVIISLLHNILTEIWTLPEILERSSQRSKMSLGKGLYKIKLSAEAEERVIRAKDVIEKIISEKQVVYGVNTGFGKFARTVVGKDQLKELQENLIRSHSAGKCRFFGVK
ncbi:hypothetical protein PHYPO_G00086620 [Pangasianodon hypophthalmus]|uniref:Histidine ammonia-lyase n=1 Tax=Pangasianodon hypophthalmus TaxID=310915 RepID=A0A5N5LGV6_PANHP|nr:hypothetical protein PHYPO_G00086620 [Pangasianodon hypophthalmus]